MGRFRWVLITFVVAALTLAPFGAGPVVTADESSLHAVFSTDLSTFTQRATAQPGDELFLVLKSSVNYGPVQVSLGNLPMAATVVPAIVGPWELVKLSSESPTAVDAVQWDTSQAEAAIFRIKINDMPIGQEFGVLDAKLIVAGPLSSFPETGRMSFMMMAVPFPETRLSEGNAEPLSPFNPSADLSYWMSQLPREDGKVTIFCWCQNAGDRMVQVIEPEANWTWPLNPSGVTMLDIPKGNTAEIYLAPGSKDGMVGPTGWKVYRSGVIVFQNVP